MEQLTEWGIGRSSGNETGAAEGAERERRS
jgi:hypothetical protein